MSLKNTVISNNKFQNANGPADSAGCHIDFNCNDIIVENNLSRNNAGGFIEILGNNYNCSYRHNLSINSLQKILIVYSKMGLNKFLINYKKGILRHLTKYYNTKIPTFL